MSSSREDGEQRLCVEERVKKYHALRFLRSKLTKKQIEELKPCCIRQVINLASTDIKDGIIPMDRIPWISVLMEEKESGKLAERDDTLFKTSLHFRMEVASESVGHPALVRHPGHLMHNTSKMPPVPPMVPIYVNRDGSYQRLARPEPHPRPHPLAYGGLHHNPMSMHVGSTQRGIGLYQQYPSDFYSSVDNHFNNSYTGNALFSPVTPPSYGNKQVQDNHIGNYARRELFPEGGKYPRMTSSKFSDSV